MSGDRQERAAALRRAVGESLGSEVVAMSALHGGDVAEAFRLQLADGTLVFAKTHHRPPPEFFVTEASGLTWLRDVGAVSVPEVLAVLDAPPGLVLEWIDESSPVASTESDFGHSLAALHRAGADRFGRADRRRTGSRGLPNEQFDTWAEAYAQNRLLPIVRLATDDGALSATACRSLEEVAARLPELGGPPEPPARLHGDLWAGNRLIGAGGVNWLIDPAAHAGHREFDLAMMRLFGGFGPECFAAYEDVFPMADGWEARVPLHQLAPLAIHAIKFGGGYVGATERALAAVFSS